jgi:hypothetical protein
LSLFCLDLIPTGLIYLGIKLEHESMCSILHYLASINLVRLNMYSYAEPNLKLQLLITILY